MLRCVQTHVAPTLRTRGAKRPSYAGFMARTFGTWLSGPPPSEAGDATQGPNDFPGQRLGLPKDGSGSLVGLGRRIVALILDWFIAYGLASLAVTFGLVSSERFLGSQIGSTAVMGIWLLLGVLSVSYTHLTLPTTPYV